MMDYQVQRLKVDSRRNFFFFTNKKYKLQIMFSKYFWDLKE